MKAAAGSYEWDKAGNFFLPVTGKAGASRNQKSADVLRDPLLVVLTRDLKLRCKSRRRRSKLVSGVLESAGRGVRGPKLLRRLRMAPEIQAINRCRGDSCEKPYRAHQVGRRLARTKLGDFTKRFVLFGGMLLAHSRLKLRLVPHFSRGNRRIRLRLVATYFSRACGKPNLPHSHGIAISGYFL